MAHTSLSRGEHTQTDRAFQLIKEMDLAAGCMGGGGGGGGDLYYWWQWLHIFSMQEYGLYLGHLSLETGIQPWSACGKKIYMTIAIPCTHLNQSYGFSKHLYVRFSFCAAIFLLNINWHLLQNIGGWISGQSLDTSKWKQFLSEACALVCKRVAF